MQTIDNKAVDPFEVEMLNRMLSKYLTFSDVAIRQINEAQVERDENAYYRITKFKINWKGDRIDVPVRVPVELHIDRPMEAAPMIVLLHILDGCVYELEIFNADSSVIDYNILENRYDKVMRV